MFTVIKRLEISASHKLVLPYRSKCASLHGHNWIITVYCRSARLNADGMVVDFTRIKEVVMENSLYHFRKHLPGTRHSRYLSAVVAHDSFSVTHSCPLFQGFATII